MNGQSSQRIFAPSFVSRHVPLTRTAPAPSARVGGVRVAPVRTHYRDAHAAPSSASSSASVYQPSSSVQESADKFKWDFPPHSDRPPARRLNLEEQSKLNPIFSTHTLCHGTDKQRADAAQQRINAMRRDTLRRDKSKRGPPPASRIKDPTGQIPKLLVEMEEYHQVYLRLISEAIPAKIKISPRCFQDFSSLTIPRFHLDFVKVLSMY